MVAKMFIRILVAAALISLANAALAISTLNIALSTQSPFTLQDDATAANDFNTLLGAGGFNISFGAFDVVNLNGSGSPSPITLTVNPLDSLSAFDLNVLGSAFNDLFVVNAIIPDITKVITINGDGGLNILDLSGLVGVKVDTGSSIFLNGVDVINYSNISRVEGASPAPEPATLALLGLGLAGLGFSRRRKPN